MKTSLNDRSGHNRRGKMKENHVYKVCRGIRNFGTKNAKIAGKITGTDPIIWIDIEQSHLRMQHEETLLKSLEEWE